MIVSFHQQFLLEVGEKVRLAGTLGKAEHPVPEVAATHTPRMHKALNWTISLVERLRPVSQVGRPVSDWMLSSGKTGTQGARFHHLKLICYFCTFKR